MCESCGIVVVVVVVCGDCGNTGGREGGTEEETGALKMEAHMEQQQQSEEAASTIWNMSLVSADNTRIRIRIRIRLSVNTYVCTKCAGCIMARFGMRRRQVKGRKGGKVTQGRAGNRARTMTNTCVDSSLDYSSHSSLSLWLYSANVLPIIFLYYRVCLVLWIPC